MTEDDTHDNVSSAAIEAGYGWGYGPARVSVVGLLVRRLARPPLMNDLVWLAPALMWTSRRWPHRPCPAAETDQVQRSAPQAPLDGARRTADAPGLCYAAAPASRERAGSAGGDQQPARAVLAAGRQPRRRGARAEQGTQCRVNGMAWSRSTATSLPHPSQTP